VKELADLLRLLTTAACCLLCLFCTPCQTPLEISGALFQANSPKRGCFKPLESPPRWNQARWNQARRVSIGAGVDSSVCRH
jgi:hypothetical protein